MTLGFYRLGFLGWDVQCKKIAYVLPARPVVCVLSTDKWSVFEVPVSSQHRCCMQPVVCSVFEIPSNRVTIRLRLNRGLAEDLQGYS